MPELRTGESFGIDVSLLAQFDWALSLKRVIHDLRTDFIYAPHIGFIYRNAGSELTAQLTKELRSGAYSPGQPLTIEVPKTFCIRVRVTPERLGPNYSRPGSILLPRDRLLYQVLADQAAPIVKAKTDKQRSFSHLLASPKSPNMFLPTRYCWNKFQRSLTSYTERQAIQYVLKLDIANYFGSLNQHTLINVLSDSGYPKALWSRLETLLTRFSGDRSSRGILQGMYPSDLLGNFYLNPVDAFLKESGVKSARYVDDLYVCIKNVETAERLLRDLIPILRSYDLVLNEAKSAIIPKTALATEEPDLEALFSAAFEEIANQVSDNDLDTDYGFQSEWEDEETEDNEDLELRATQMLFDSIPAYRGSEENIERFCLPLFVKARSAYAVAHVMDAFRKRPSMTQIYVAYLAAFLREDTTVSSFLVRLVRESTLLDWQRMWILAGLLRVKPKNDAAVRIALDLFEDTGRHEALRAVAAIYVGRYGDYARRQAIRSRYSSCTEYLKAAIYYASKDWPGAERQNAKALWGGHAALNSLLSAAFANG